MSDWNSPTAVCNEALDAAGLKIELGDIQEGTEAARVCLRTYGNALRQMLRGCNWDFCRREAPLVLLADATGATPNVGTTVPSGFAYEYAYPTDCAKLRYIPANLNQTIPGPNTTPTNGTVPLMTGLGGPFIGRRNRPTPFLLTNDTNYPPATGQMTWDVQGVSPQGRVVILSNVQNAHAVYSYYALYPSLWDQKFRSALVAYIAHEIAFRLHDDPKLGMAVRTEQMKVAMLRLQEARVTDGNEGWSTSDLSVDWMRTRNVGGQWEQGGNSGWGAAWNGGWDQVTFSNGSAY